VSALSRSAHGLSTPVDDGWWRDAQCRREDPELFFTESTEARAEALHICRSHCPVLRECRREARARPPVGAVQGGEAYNASGKRNGYDFKPASTCRHCWPERPIRPTTETGACGESKGYARHIRRNERPCAACAEAKRADMAARQAAFKARHSGAVLLGEEG
jgi:hypothetical protein